MDMRLTLGVEHAKDLWPELLPLAEAHYAEIRHHGGTPMSINQALYESLDADDLLRVFTVRRDGVLVGYCVMCIRTEHHSTSSKCAHEDCIYLKPECRGRTGSQFLRWIDEYLASEGIAIVYRNVPTIHNHGPLLQRCGYRPIEVIWVRELQPQLAAVG